MERIDMTAWNRREHYEFFSRADYPQFNVCANLDITRFRAAMKARGIPFYFAVMHAATRVANGIENFRTRIREDGVVLHERVHPSFTWMDEGEDLFRLICAELTPDMDDDIAAFAKAAGEKARSQTAFMPIEELSGRDDFLYITCLPWVAFTHISHTITLNRRDSVPRISWGKFFTEGGRVLLPFSVQVHHALADGLHVGRYYERLQALMDEM